MSNYNSLSTFLASRAGKRFYNFAYCWGACLVILGAVFKIAHMPYDNLLLMVGLFTEVTIFFISGFEEPAREYKWERIFPALNRKKGEPAAAAGIPGLDGMVSEGYLEEVKRLEANVSALNAAYEKQLEKVTGCADAVDPATFSSLQAHTRQLAENVERLNRQYEKLLGAMNVKS